MTTSKPTGTRLRVVRGGCWDNDRRFYVRVSLEEIQFGSQLRGTDTGFRVTLPGRAKRA